MNKFYLVRYSELEGYNYLDRYAENFLFKKREDATDFIKNELLLKYDYSRRLYYRDNWGAEIETLSLR